MRERAADGVAARLRAAILGGRWRPGERLPSQQELAERFGVSRLTVREATERLVAEGLVAVRQGDGVRVLDPVRSGRLDLIGALLALRSPGGPLPLEPVRDVLELRRLLALALVELAHRRGTPEARAALEERLAAVRGAEDALALARADAALVDAIVALADNLALRLLAGGVQRLLGQAPEVLVALFAEPHLNLRANEAAVACVQRGPGEGRRAAFRDALVRLDRACLERLGAGGNDQDLRLEDVA